MKRKDVTVSISQLNVDPMVLAAQAARAFAQTHPLAYAQISEELTIRQVSHNFSRLIRTERSCIGQPLTEVVWFLAGLEKTLNDILEGLLPLYTLEHVNYTQADGSTGYLDFQITPLDDLRPGYGLLLLVEDSTQVGRLQQALVQERNELRLSQKELDKANLALHHADRQKSLFLSIVAHDLRGPLAAIQGMAGLMQDQQNGGGEIRYDFFDKIIGQTERLNEMVSDLLDLDRIELGEFQIDPAITDLKEIVQDVISVIQPDIKIRSLTLEAQLPENPLFIFCDEGRLWRVVYNLLSNAFKYTRRGGTIKVQLEEDLGKLEVVLSISDNGIGMSQAQTERLFQLYYRTQKVKEEKISGTGLGLFIVKSLVEAHKGRVEVLSQPEKAQPLPFIYQGFPQN